MRRCRAFLVLRKGASACRLRGWRCAFPPIASSCLCAFIPFVSCGTHNNNNSALHTITTPPLSLSTSIHTPLTRNIQMPRRRRLTGRCRPTFCTRASASTLCRPWWRWCWATSGTASRSCRPAGQSRCRPSTPRASPSEWWGKRLTCPLYYCLVFSVRIALFCFVLFCFVLFCFVLFCFFIYLHDLMIDRYIYVYILCLCLGDDHC